MKEMEDGYTGTVVFTETDLLPLSGLQHFLFCERRAALVHVENLWSDNLATAEGGVLHGKLDLKVSSEQRGRVRIAQSLALRSFRLGLIGRADVVEFHLSEEAGVSLPGVKGRWRPFPVEFKRGRLRREISFEVQLCAQAFCLEEMLGAEIPGGAIFYGKTRRRKEVDFDEKLRRKTEEAAREFHNLIRSGETPKAEYQKKCDQCSLYDLCLPKTLGRTKNVTRYLAKNLFET